MTPRLLLAAALVAGLLSACGGGASTENDAGRGQRVTDPAKVPSATPLQNPVLYRIQGDVISALGGTASVPSSGTPAAGGGIRTYTVKAGDTCSTIAANNGISVDALIRANRSIDPSCTTLRIGDQLRIPSATPTPGPAGTTRAGGGGKTYTVRSGDTCDAIARNQGVEVARLIAANNLDSDCARLQVGQVLQIP